LPYQKNPLHFDPLLHSIRGGTKSPKESLASASRDGHPLPSSGILFGFNSKNNSKRRRKKKKKRPTEAETEAETETATCPSPPRDSGGNIK
jgi:hypothetical protein